LQSIERFDPAQGEGFAHFYAAKIFNDAAVADGCEFVYYKEVLLDACPPGRTDCKPFGDAFVVPPPVAVSCSAADKWRNNQCAAQTDSADPIQQMIVQAANQAVLRRGTERDWLQFFWAWNTGTSGTPLSQITEAYQQTCNPGACINPDGSRDPACVLEPCTGVTLV
jgi:hypothetical protein